jgi:hypothetical protein
VLNCHLGTVKSSTATFSNRIIPAVSLPFPQKFSFNVDRISNVATFWLRYNILQALLICAPQLQFGTYFIRAAVYRVFQSCSSMKQKFSQVKATKLLEGGFHDGVRLSGLRANSN